MIVRYTPRAVADLTAIADYIRAHNPSAATSVAAAITGSVDRLARHPRLGSERPELRVRALGVPRFPYTIYYRLTEAAIYIVHIRDDRRAPLSTDDV